MGHQSLGLLSLISSGSTFTAMASAAAYWSVLFDLDVTFLCVSLIVSSIEDDE